MLMPTSRQQVMLHHTQHHTRIHLCLFLHHMLLLIHHQQLIKSTTNSLSNTISISCIPTSFCSISTNTLCSSTNCLPSCLSTTFSISSRDDSTTSSISRVLSPINSGPLLSSW